ncbi:uncharacterized protein LOC135102840 [Scylla paramamosain]|uniref:uncharacterized protein LOC135102840 n=1 Tax=Scylla paramamosain TaxID=85552 RepID=UPI0030829A0C
MSNASASASSGSPNTLHVSATIKGLPIPEPISEFRGESPQERAHDFIRSCEDVMRSNPITDEDKIFFVKSKLAGEASRMMNTSAFSPREIGTSYANFKKNFLKIFGNKSQTDLMALASKVSVRLAAEANSLHEMKALIPTHQFVTDYMDVLQLNNWFQGDSMTETNFRRLLEFIFYMALVNEEVRKNASYFSFKPGDTVADLAVLIREKKGLPGSSLETQISLVAPLVSDDQSEPCAAAMAKPGNVCSYCHKIGHVEKICFKKQKDQKLASNKSDSKNKAKGNNLSVRPRTGVSPHVNTGRTRCYKDVTTQYCIIHGQCKHSSEQCKDIINMRIEKQVRIVQSSRGKTSAL